MLNMGEYKINSIHQGVREEGSKGSNAIPNQWSPKGLEIWPQGPSQKVKFHQTIKLH